ncbi:truncated hemoglobin YjbI [Evansella vedderi]|uniref:Truncated hemoglobin YjbI n=1 Tax=Evansella vedderi TaxID=38282 RepID=A0ABT9ZWF9_9BACI|nr:hypothetical protein [Evansella vedderi]MDQ0255558.1 truncated hemoglobin YjbI [Evansella vedderi]
MIATQITIPEDNSLVEVKRLQNQLVVGESKIRLRELLFALMEMIEPEELLEIVVNHGGMIEEVLEPIISEKDEKSIMRLLNIFYERAKSEENLSVVGQIFKTTAQRFDISQLAPETLSQLLSLVLQRVEDLKEPETFDFLFLTLLERLNVTDAKGELVTRVLQSTLNIAKKEERQDVIKSMFHILAGKAEQDWVRSVLAPYLKERKVVRSPILPKNCVLYMEELDGTKICVIEVDKQKFDVKYHNTEYENVGHPKMLFEFHVTPQQRIRTARIYAVKDTVIKPETKIYRYPFSNVYGDFRACWPDIYGEPIKDIHQLTTKPFLFINSPSNDHLYRGKNLRDVFASLQGKSFDDSLLEETGLTVKEQIMA